MATPQNALSPEKRPITTCGVCSSPLCPHLVCRVCGSCSECNEIQIAEVKSGQRFAIDRVLGTSTPAAAHRRLEYLRGCGIAEEDYAEASRALDNLRSDCCRPGQCDRRKRVTQSFCTWCFGRLPEDLKLALGLHLRAGYLTHYRRATQILDGISANAANAADSKS
jgi:hypothetical protein